MIINIEEIKSLIPHREPFLFIDQILKLESNSVTGLKHVNKNEYYFRSKKFLYYFSC